MFLNNLVYSNLTDVLLHVHSICFQYLLISIKFQEDHRLPKIIQQYVEAPIQ